MTTQQTFKFFSDPGHGWLAVPRALLRELGIEARISHFSYQKDHMVYLEEDCDYSCFIRAMREQGRDCSVVDQPGDADYIRHYEGYRPS